ncbi:MAG TPA: SIR2 family protein [Pyrinomonadaceae bacterium]|nr:SIR2 family protein [Pyrinomonadaceae bacterium]
MAERNYNWQRFWWPSGSGDVQASEEGYLWGPGAYNPNIVTFEQIMNVSCLALLGEPGIGKSKTLEREFDALVDALEGSEDRAVFLNLRSYGSEDRLVRALFESTEFTRWTGGSYHLHLFLDSLDECLLRIDTVAAILIDELKKYPVERLSLRVACRTAEYPRLLDGELKKLWGDENYKVYELLPLTREDVAEAARVEGLDPHEFLREVRQREAGPFAAKPITLSLLLDLFRDGGSLPSTQAKLYEDGCRALCEESNESRIASNLRGVLNIDQRMVVASRIAAVTVFANRASIWTGPDRQGATDEDVSVRELQGGSEEINGSSFDVTEDVIRETLATGLFNLRGTDRLGWAHQTYAEYLAAWYLRHRKLDADRVMELLTHPDDPDGKLVPQLYETAAWAATLIPDLFRRIMVADADVVLRSDVAAVDADDRAALVEALLRLYEEERITHDWERQNNYHKLAHPGLAEQLRPYITDTSKHEIARRTAILIAEECELHELQDELVRVALDGSEKHWLRERAAGAVSDLGDSETKAKLRPLAINKLEDDPNQELKGYALTAVWPEHMTAQELFATLTPPRESFFGSYYLFISQHLVSGLRPEDLPTALAWVENLGQRHQLSITLGQVTDQIILYAWEQLEAPGVLEAFSRTALARLRHYDDVIEVRYRGEPPSSFAEETEKRRRVLETFLTLVEEPEKSWHLFINSRALRVFASDRIWLVERLRTATSENARLTLLKLVKYFFQVEVEPEHLEALEAAVQEDNSLREELGYLFYIASGTPEEAQARENYALLQQWNKRDEEPPLVSPSPAERVEKRLSHFEGGQLAAWWWLSEDLSLEPRDTHYNRGFKPDITTFPGWLKADEAMRRRIIASAGQYVRQGDPELSVWFGKDTFSYSALAGYRALRLLLRENPDQLETLDAEIWGKWAPIILTYPVTSGVDEDKDAAHRALVARAYRHAPDEVIKCVLALIDFANEKDGYFQVGHDFDGCWDERFAQALLTKAKDPALKPRLVGQLLGKLLKHHAAEAQAFAESLVTLGADDTTAHELAVTAACQLMAHSPDAGWQVVWPAIRRDEKFGREVSESLEYILREGKGRFYGKLPEDQVADYYIWLSRQYPHAEDPVYEGVHFVGPRESLATWRDALLKYLKERGTAASVRAISRIVNELPQLEWLKYTLLDARQNTRRRSWVPLHPAAIITLSSRGNASDSPDRGEAALMTQKKRIVVTNHLPTEWAGRPLDETPNLLPMLERYAEHPDRVALFTGAGLSSPLFPRWPILLEKLVDECEAQGKLEYEKNELLEKIKKGEDYLDIADSCALALGISGYRDFIRRHFNIQFGFDNVPRAYRELLALDIRVVLTTNWDRIPEVGGRGTYNIFSNRRVSDAIRANADRQKFAMLLHGEANDAESLIFTRDDYDRLVYRNEQPMRDFLKIIFMSETVLFMGFSFTDPHLDLVLSAIHATNAGNVLQHFVVLPNITTFNKDTLERRFGVRVIPYVPSDDSHPEVLQFVQLLSALKKADGV